VGEPAKPLISTNVPSLDSIHTLQPRAPYRALRVLIADDHETVRMGLCAVLKSRADIEVCAEAKNGEEAVAKSRQLSPDLIILDITMPLLGGVEAAQQIRVLLPPDVPILFYSMHNAPQVVDIAKSVGAKGFVAKDQMAATLLDAVDVPRNNGTFFSF
jgi:DNA-binding NarL/FixJ family response regulator